MAQLGERSIRITVNDEQIWDRYKLAYDTDKNFVGQVPDKWVGAVEAMTKTEREQFKAIYRNKPRKYGVWEAVIIAKSEETVTDNMKKLLERLHASQVKTRRVIIIDFEHKDGESRSWRHGTFDQVELDFSFGYFEEISGLSSKVIYKQKEHNHNSYDPKKSEIVIDDTPEARAFMTDILDKMNVLGQKLDEFLHDRPRMIEAILKGDQKLIS